MCVCVCLLLFVWDESYVAGVREGRKWEHKGRKGMNKDMKARESRLHTNGRVKLNS